MSVQVENLEKNMAKLTIEVSADELEKALQSAYLKQKNNISIPGFRKGKVPRVIVEKIYGPDILYEDAANELIPKAYFDAVFESKLDVVSQPKVNVVQIEQGKLFVFTAEVAVKPEVTLGVYKALEVQKADLTVSDEEIEAELKKEQEKNSRRIDIENRPTQIGDIVTIDFEGSVNGETFAGGVAKGYSLTLGSNTFIPGFEEQLMGVKLKEEVDVNVIFPKDYNAEELKGKTGIFKCIIQKIETKELPELDDDFAKDVSEFNTLDEYKADVKKSLKKKKEAEAKHAKEDTAVEKAVANAFMEIPEAMMQSQMVQMMDNFVKTLRAQGMSMEQYMQYSGKTLEQVQGQMRTQVIKQIRTRLVLEKVAEVEQIEANERIKKNLAVQEAVAFLAEHAVEVDTSDKS